MQRGKQLYSGKAKTVYESDRNDALILHFRDDTSAFDGEKVEQLARKGIINNQFNAYVMKHLADAGIETHFLELLSADESLVRRLDMIPIECVVRNRASGSMTKRLGIEDGTILEPPTFEFFLKDDALHDPMVNEYHIETFGWADADDVESMKAITFRVNDVLKELFASGDMLLVDFKLEFGKQDGKIFLGDEFSPDGCRIWDSVTKERMDKDRFRRGLGGVIEAYEEVAKRIGLEL
ncbi:MAG: phosphoribosylaminoimidazolesuccinocarboxamide synthase [Arenicella sp.]|jgi:phosphoribosylaminoimidazole-succinocarboxamide synthase|nr:phosphoribosylaminoimidazolesuccinocarboxamide synthase [Arenicella sp.]HAU66826.1 phosphoribosylaminoimidazolesuccinocarboxamide synthase [Gammaproteobacteria bacterium]